MAIINGTTSDDVLFGTSENDILDGGAGNDLLTGSGGFDTYVFGAGSGQDTIDLTTNYNDYGGFAIQMSGLATADVTFSRAVNSPYDLVLSINGTTDTLTIKNYFWHTTQFTFQFSDGSLDWQAMVQLPLSELWVGTDGNDSLQAWGNDPAIMNGNAGDDFLNGTQYDDIVNGGDGNDTLSGGMVNTAGGWVSGNDTLDGGAGNDTLQGLQGNDTLIGGTGDDTYWFNLGDGQDTIQEYDWTSGNVDTVRFGPGIAATDITFARNGMDLVLGIAGTTDQITIQKWGWGEAWRIERFVFADGTIWDATQISAHIPFSDSITGTGGIDSLSVWTGESGTVQGLEGDDSLFGGNGNDTLIGGIGNDVLSGGLGDDVYVFNRGDGQDCIIEYGGNLDTIRFGAEIAEGDVTFTRSGMDLVLGIAGTTDQITIQGWGSGYQYPIDRIEFADGTVWDQTRITSGIPSPGIITGTSGSDSLSAWAGESAILQGLDGDDSLYGNNGTDTLIGGIGNDYLSGGYGDDAYAFNLGDGRDRIVDEAGNLDTIKFGVGIAAGNITGALNGADLVLSIAGTTDQITIQNWGYGAPWGIEQIEFADGTVWSAAQIANLVGGGSGSINGTEASDFLSGTESNDVINGLGGNDTLDGGMGSVWDPAAGAWVWDPATQNFIWDPVAGNWVYVSGNDTLDGGAGNDLLIGHGGMDTYLFGVGSGQDTIDLYTAYSDGTVQLTGLAKSDVTFSRVVNNPNDLVLSINGTADSLTIKGYYMQPGMTGNFMFQFTDGMLDATSISALPVMLDGTEGTDTLYTPPDIAGILNGNGGDDLLMGGGKDDALNGGAGNDTLDGGMGNDILQGGDGDDTLSDTAGANLLNGGAGADILSGNIGNEMFVGGIGNDVINTGDGADILAFNRGDGTDVVNGGIGADNTISLGGGIGYADIALSKVNNDLILEVGNGDQITLANWYDIAANYKSVIDLQVMADAMAGFDPASGDPLMNRAVQNFDFTAIVNAFDQAHGGSATYMHWSATSELLAAHLSGSDTMALGGDLAHQYGTNGSFTGMNLAAAQTALNDPQFGGAQTLNPLQGLQGGAVTL